MPDTPTRSRVDLLYLHGVNDPQSRPWDETLNLLLKESGHPDGLRPTRILAPDYRPALDGHVLSDAILTEKRTPPKPGTNEDVALRTEYRLRHAQAHARLNAAVDRDVVPDPINKLRPVVRPVVMKSKARQAENYAKDSQVRNAVLESVLSEVQDSDRLVIVSHSLGTLVALRLLRYLPKGMSVPLLLTVASPLAADPLFRRTLPMHDGLFQFPYGVVDLWVNVFNPLDYVAGGSGLRKYAPEALDVVSKPGRSEHGFSPIVSPVEGLGALLSGTLYPKARRRGPRTKTIKFPKDSVFPLLISHLARCQLEAVRQEAEKHHRLAKKFLRFEGAVVMATHLTQEEWKRDKNLRGVAHLLAEDASGPLRERMARKGASVVDAALLMALANPIEPFEIDIPGGTKRKARRQYLSSLGLSTVTLDDVQRALDEAAIPFRTFRQRVPKPVWIGLGAVGAAAAVAAPVLLMGGIAGAGFVGAAAIAVGLAGFGPGGMIGGLLTLSLAVGAGTAVAALGLGTSMARTSPAEFQQSTVELLARAQLSRHLLVPGAGLTEWTILTKALAQVEADLFQVSGTSDKDAPGVRGLHTKKRTAETALDWLRAHKLGPRE